MKLRLLDKIVDKTYESLVSVNTFSRCTHATYIIRKNNILSVGWNHARKTHPDLRRFGSKYFHIHSEFSAIRRFPLPPRELEKCTFVNVRIGKDGLLRLSKPCIVCATMLSYFNVTDIFYTDDCGKFIKLA
jgi:tRNA(Arg) A34 adenosine deaminase TadA